MRIICNCGDDGEAFYMGHYRASVAIGKAKDAMLKCSQTAKDEAARRRYDAMHKKIARMLRDWNRIEQERENDPKDHANTGAAS
jgi:hypothetical protein